MTKKEATKPLPLQARRGRPDYYFLEYAMDRGGCFYRGTSGKYLHGYANIAPLVKAGYVVLDREEVRDFGTQLYFRPTPEGIRWWIKSRADKFLRSQAEMAVKYPPDKYPNFYRISTDPATLLEQVGFKGIGSLITFYASGSPSVWIALDQGLFDFVSHRDYSGAPHNCEEYVTVSLTAKGMRYFDSLPRLVLECA